MYSTETEGPGPTIISKSGPECKLCGNRKGTIIIHFPPFQFMSGDFKAVPWFEHEKYYCPYCDFIWTDWLDKLSLEEYGAEYIKANTDDQRKPAETRMAYGFLLLKKIIYRYGGKRFLDYGVGYNSPYIYELRGRGIDLWGCDISHEIRYSKFVKQLPFEELPENTFDGIYSTSVVEHLANFEADFECMKKLLKTGGIIVHAWYLYPYWDGKSDFPRDAMVWDPWHVSILSDNSAKILANKLNLTYLGLKKVEGGKVFVFKKPGGIFKIPFLFWISPLTWVRVFSLFNHKRYLKKYYGITIGSFTVVLKKYAMKYGGKNKFMVKSYRFLKKFTKK